MPVVRFSNEDFLAGKVVKPGYHHALVKNIITKPAKKDGSDVHNIQLKIVEPGDYLGVPLTDYISEKAMGTAIPFVKACNDGNEPKADENYELANGVGKVIKVHISNTLFEGKVKNTIDGYDVADPSFKSDE